MIKICYIIGQLNRAGAERQLYELVKGINEDIFRPIVISLSEGGHWAEEIRKLRIELIEIPRKKNKEFARLFRLIKILKTIKPDIIHTYLFSANSYGRIAAILARVPIIIASERNLPVIGKDKNMAQMIIDKMLAFFTDGIICNSEKARETLVNKYAFDNSKVQAIHNGIEFSHFYRGDKSNAKELGDVKVVGTIGRLYPQKNHWLFLEVAKLILDRCENTSVRFLIVGDGPLRKELVAYSKKLGVDKNVIFTGERPDIPKLLQNMDIFVMTSLYEGMSNSIMEAMAAGRPVVATDVGGNNELIIDGDTGYLCPSGDADSLVRKIVYLIHNAGKAERIGEKGRKMIITEFSVEKMVTKTETLYTGLLDKKFLKDKMRGRYLWE